jgi:hypothetical protein
VKPNKGAAGTDGQTIEDFERKLKKIWRQSVPGQAGCESLPGNTMRIRTSDN